METTTISDLSPELLEEILSKVPLASLSKVRSTSKQWNDFSKDRVVCKAAPKQQFLGFLMKDFRVFSLRFNLKRDGSYSYGAPSIKQNGKLDQLIKVSRLFHCAGLVLCVRKDYACLEVWNPYLGQTRLIETDGHYMNKFGLGYDSSRSYKILRFIDDYVEDAEPRIVEYQIYDFHSDSWRVLDVTPDWYIESFRSDGLSVKGNTYWIAQDRRKSEEEEEWVGEEEWVEEEEFVDDFLLYFDFTRERFGPRLKLPSRDDYGSYGSLACVREEQLAVMVRHDGSYKMQIWVTTKIDPEFVSWSKFLVYDMTPSKGLRCAMQHGSFFIDEEKKVAVLFNLGSPFGKVTTILNIAYIIGEDEYYMEVDLGESTECISPIVCSYVPSLVQIKEKA